MKNLKHLKIKFKVLVFISLSLIISSCDSNSILFDLQNHRVQKIIPVLQVISDQSLDELMSIVTINASDEAHVNNEGLSIKYSCYYDNNVDGNVETNSLCSELSGVSFDIDKGVLNWSTVIGSANTYEMRISGSAQGAIANEIFIITINPLYPLTMTFRTQFSHEYITLPSVAGFVYDYKVDWGDGSEIENFNSSTSQTHFYIDAGDYEVRVYGEFPAIRFGTLAASEQNKLIKVNDLGKTSLVDLGRAFFNCTKLTSFKNANGDTSKVTDMNSMFGSTYEIVEIDLSGMDTTNVLDMYGMFYMSGVSSLDLSGFNVEKVTDMSSMFKNTGLINLDLSSFNPKSVTDMSSMFYFSTSLANITFSNFNTEKVKDMTSMFQGTVSLTSLDLSSFKTSSVRKMNQMFYYATALTNLNLQGWTLGSEFYSNPDPITSMFHQTPGDLIVSCVQNPIGNDLGITCL